MSETAAEPGIRIKTVENDESPKIESGIRIKTVETDESPKIEGVGRKKRITGRNAGERLRKYMVGHDTENDDMTRQAEADDGLTRQRKTTGPKAENKRTTGSLDVR